MHPLRKLRESGGNTPAAVAKLLAENVRFHSPLLVRAVEGRERVAVILATSPKIRHGTYTAEYRLDDRNTFLRWQGKIEGREIESLGVVTDNDQGLVVEYTIAFRPLPAAQIFRDVMYPIVASAPSVVRLLKRNLGIKRTDLASELETNAEQQARDFRPTNIATGQRTIFPITTPESTSLERRARGAHANGTDR
jgi:hypothetical protein